MTGLSNQAVRPGNFQCDAFNGEGVQGGGQASEEAEQGPGDDDVEEQWHLFGEGDDGEVVNPDRPGDWMMTEGNRPDVGADAEDHWDTWRLQEDSDDGYTDSAP